MIKYVFFPPARLLFCDLCTCVCMRGYMCVRVYVRIWERVDFSVIWQLFYSSSFHTFSFSRPRVSSVTFVDII